MQVRRLFARNNSVGLRRLGRCGDMHLNKVVILPLLLLAPIAGSVRHFFNVAAKWRPPTDFVEPTTPFIEQVAAKKNVSISDVLSKDVQAISDVLSKDVQASMKLGVLFLNLGGPETTEDVEGFLYNLFADPDIIRLPPIVNILQSPLAYFIAKTRAPKSAAAYKSIGGGSPIVKYTREQARLVQETLQQKGFTQAKCYFAMRYWHPFTDEVLSTMQKDGVESVVVVPLYPHYSVSTSGSSLKLLNQLFAKHSRVWGTDKVPHTVVPAWYQRPGYIRVVSRLLLEQLAQFSKAEMAEGVHVLFSAHGVPVSYIENGDPYLKHITECVELITAEVKRQLASDTQRPPGFSAKRGKRLAGSFVDSAGIVGAVKRMFQGGSGAPQSGEVAGQGDQSADATVVKPVQFHLSFQSRVGPVQWLRPYTDDKIRELAVQGKVRNLIVVPISFVSEHIETLEEIDCEFKELAEECGVAKWRRVPALNLDAGFIQELADIVVDALQDPTVTVAQAASKEYTDYMLTQSALPVAAVGSNGSGGSGSCAAPN